MKQTRRTSPLVILAFDSGDANLIEQWSADGYLPTIRRVVESGVRGELGGSEMISENGIWISLFSGLSRAQHGYYYWRPQKLGTYELTLSNQNIAGVDPFWSRLRDTDARVLVFDVPEIHCVPGLNGVQVANWAPHNPRFKGYSEPSSSFNELSQRFGAPLGVEERVGSTLEEDKRIYRQLLAQIEQKSKILAHLVEQGHHDVVVIGFPESHIAGHQFWRYANCDNRTDESESSLSNATRDVYQAIDNAFARVLAQLPEESNVVVTSNMGLQADYPSMELTQEFCRQLGYLRQQPAAGSKVTRFARQVIPTAWQRTISNALPDQFRGKMLSGEWLGGVDWSSSTLFPIPSYFLGFLRVNLQGREPAGIVTPGRDYEALLDQVEADLNQLIDPVSNQPAVRHVVRTSALYQCDPHESLPDIFFDWQPAPYPRRVVEHPRATLEQKDLFFNRDTRHNVRGLFAAAGPDISHRGFLGELSVLDVAPTCLSLMRQPIPESMKGSVLAFALE